MVVVASVVVVPVGRVDRGVIVMSTSRRGNSVVGGSNPCSDVGNDAVVLLAVVVVVVTDDVVANGFSSPTVTSATEVELKLDVSVSSSSATAVDCSPTKIDVCASVDRFPATLTSTVIDVFVSVPLCRMSSVLTMIGAGVGKSFLFLLKGGGGGVKMEFENVENNCLGLAVVLASSLPMSSKGQSRSLFRFSLSTKDVASFVETELTTSSCRSSLNDGSLMDTSPFKIWIILFTMSSVDVNADVS